MEAVLEEGGVWVQVQLDKSGEGWVRGDGARSEVGEVEARGDAAAGEAVLILLFTRQEVSVQVWWNILNELSG